MTTAMNTEQRYMPYREAARYTGMSEMTLRRQVEAGRLKVFRPTAGRLVVFDRDDLDRFVRGSNADAAE